MNKERRKQTTRYLAAGSALVVATLISTLRLTPVAGSTNTVFSNNLDTQSTGALLTGTGANQFSGTSGSARLSVENTVVSSPPNALSVAVNGGGSAYAYTQYSSAYTQYDLTFNLRLGTDLTLPGTKYMNLAQTGPGASSRVGNVSVVLPGVEDPIRLDYVDSVGTQHYLWGNGYVFPTGSWHTVELRETVGAGSGSLALLVDGTTV